MTGFDGYLADYETARGEAQEALDKYAHCNDPQRREELVVEARSAIDEVDRYIRILENESQGSKEDAVAKRRMMDKVRRCKTEYTSLTSSLEKAILIGDARAVSTETSSDIGPKEQATRYAERLDRNGRHLDEAQRTLAETEAIAANAAGNLLQQRNQLQHTQMNVAHAQEDTEEAKGHLRRLAIKAVTNRIILVLVILALGVAIALVSYYKWYPRNKKDYLGLLPKTTSPPAANNGR